MPEVPVSINGRNYRIACGEGEEQRLMALAGMLEQRVQALVRQFGQVGEGHLLVAASLLLADELDEARGEIGRVRNAPPVTDPQLELAIEGVASSLDMTAERIEAIAERLERA